MTLIDPRRRSDLDAEMRADIKAGRTEKWAGWTWRGLPVTDERVQAAMEADEERTRLLDSIDAELDAAIRSPSEAITKRPTHECSPVTCARWVELRREVPRTTWLTRLWMRVRRWLP